MTMQAAVYQQYGTPEVMQLKTVDIPKPAADEVLIKVMASSVSSGDWHVRAADPWAVRLFNGLWRPKRQILGSELAGVVAATGSDVSEFKVGDAVFGATGLQLGANAEYIALPESGPLAIKPSLLTFEQAAAIPFGAVTSWYFLNQVAELQKGQRILIYGASGALGVYAIQLAKYLGAEVTALCSGNNIELVKSLGADEVIDYQQQEYLQSDFAKWDVIFDTVGKASFKQAKSVMTERGQFIAAAGGLKEMWQGIQQKLMNCFGLSQQSLKMGIAIETKEVIEKLKALVGEGRLEAVIGRDFYFGDIVEAHHYVESGRKVGTAVLRICKEGDGCNLDIP